MPASLSASVRSGMAWMAGLAVFRDVLQFAVMIVLTRMIDPAAYGQFALITAITGVGAVLSFRVFLEHTLQQRDGEPDYQLHFTVGAATQIALFTALNLLALILRTTPRWRGIAMPLHLISLLPLFDWPGELRVKMLERSMDWSRLRLLQGVALVAGAVAALIAAFAGAHVYALLVQTLVTPIPFAIDLFVGARWRPSFVWNRAAFLPAWRYGRTRLASGLTITGRQLLESGTLARVVGFGPLGIYGRAAGLASLCCLKAPSMLTLALFPVLTRMEPGSAQGRRAAALLFRAIAWSVIPAGAFLSIAASPAVRLLYGEKWTGAIPLVPWALGAFGLAALGQTASTLLLSSMRQNQCLRLDLMNLAGAAACLWWLLPRGLTAYLGGLIMVNGACLAVQLVWLVQSGSLGLNDLGDTFFPPLAASVALLALAGIGGPLPEDAAAAALIATVVVLSYVLILRILAERSLRELTGFVPGGAQIRRLLLLGEGRA
ncbi:MAG: oligosaccharide flippase family protein [Bryobacteraceae bacterium]